MPILHSLAAIEIVVRFGRLAPLLIENVLYTACLRIAKLQVNARRGAAYARSERLRQEPMSYCVDRNRQSR